MESIAHWKYSILRYVKSGRYRVEASGSPDSVSWRLSANPGRGSKEERYGHGNMYRRRDMGMYAQKRKHMYHPDLERAKCMEDVYHILARKILMGAKQNTSENSRYVVGVAGCPGSGKSTLAKQVVHIINAIQGEECVIMLPMDGYHYTKAELDRFEDPLEAHARRGAHWTFDAEGFVDMVENIAKNTDEIIYAPTFDHGQGDPVERGVCIEKHHAIVIVEGNYVLLDMEPWNRLRYVFNETCFIDCDIDEAMRRVYNRQTRNGATPRESRHRIETNDRPNALQIQETAEAAHVLVPSLHFRRPYWK